MFTHPGEQEEYERGRRARQGLLTPSSDGESENKSTFLGRVAIPLLILVGVLAYAFFCWRSAK